MSVPGPADAQSDRKWRTVRDLTGDASVVGIIGRPVSHSLSPLMHNRAFAHLGLDWVYVPFPVHGDAVGRAIHGLRALAVRGVNVTIPYKTDVIPLLDRLTPAAAAIGAVNTIINDGTSLVGDNTDGIGFVRALRDEAAFDPAGSRVVILGAGGGARAIAVELARAGAATVVIANRTLSKAQELCSLVGHYGASVVAADLRPATLESHIGAADLLVQTTPAGMAAARPARRLAERTNDPTATSADASTPTVPELPINPSWLRPSLLVSDIVYTPPETPLLAAARQQGCRTLQGWGMLLYQGVEAFDRWTGRRAPVEVMRAALLQALTSGR